MITPTPTAANRAIWHFYQNQLTASFTGAQPRLDFMLKTAARLYSNTAPRVLNIGVGAGYLEQQALAQGWPIFSFDLDPETLVRLLHQGIPGCCGTLEALPFIDGIFDIVIASEVLEHLNDSARQKGIREIARVLKPGGWFIGSVPYREDLSQSIVMCPECGAVFHRWGHQRAFDSALLEADLQHDFTHVKTQVTAYLSFHDRSFYGLLNTLMRYLLAKIKMPIASTSLVFIAQRGKLL